jgi:hypothetical protein
MSLRLFNAQGTSLLGQDGRSYRRAVRQDVSSNGGVLLLSWVKGFHTSEFLLVLSAIVIRVTGHFYYRSSVLVDVSAVLPSAGPRVILSADSWGSTSVGPGGQ